MKQYFGIDIGGTAVKLGIVDETGRVLLKGEESVSFDGYQTPVLTTVRKVFVVDLGLSVLCSLVLFFGGEQIVGLFMTDYNSQIVYAAKEYLFAISLCYSLVSVLFVLRNTLQGLGCTYANAVAGAGELIGRITVSYLFTPLFGFKAVCFAGPVAWLLADLPLIVLYWRKAKQMRKLSNQ